ncbi:hypothetical protein IHE45_17G058300 [Dioscorea alata]|uniref:Uncharacterized protein n=1 Tax=Dioscorea alata TaxID=55571 RepID=A0ACB7UCM4_DIOAL|nr:hypothetical protein IHE45_17G058300 [Dioscorea alata]
MVFSESLCCFRGWITSRKLGMLMALLMASYFWRMSKCYHTLFTFIITL